MVVVNWNLNWKLVIRDVMYNVPYSGPYGLNMLLYNIGTIILFVHIWLVDLVDCSIKWFSSF